MIYLSIKPFKRNNTRGTVESPRRILALACLSAPVASPFSTGPYARAAVRARERLLSKARPNRISPRAPSPVHQLETPDACVARRARPAAAAPCSISHDQSAAACSVAHPACAPRDTPRDRAETPRRRTARASQGAATRCRVAGTHQQL